MKRLEDVFKTNGPPTYTFVRPLEYSQLLVSLRTPGRGVVIEGPSGIGKTTAVTRALDELGLSEKVARLTSRKRDDAHRGTARRQELRNRSHRRLP